MPDQSHFSISVDLMFDISHSTEHLWLLMFEEMNAGSFKVGRM